MEADDLYGVALERFVAERRELARSLRAAGRRKQASEVEKLRKPTLAAWAVNQLVRTQRRAVGQLFDAGDQLCAAHQALLEGRGGSEELRAAVERERAAVGSLVETARGLLSSEGHELSEAVIGRVADTLHAAALDDAGRDQVRDGRLERELRHVGLGMAGAPEPRRRRRRAERKPPDALKAATAAEAETRKRAERARRALEAAELQRDQAAQALRVAEEALASARAEAEAAADAHSQAQRALSRTKR